MGLYLTKEQERILDGKKGEGLARCYRLLVRLGDAFGAKRLIPVKSVHLSGISYKSIGDPGLEFLEDLSREVRFRVRTTTNPCGMDLRKWRETGIKEEFASSQLRILRALRRMGARMTLSCTPYYLCQPSVGEHLAWAESSAVCYANSVLGARTNREGAPSALASAVTGMTPEFGLHLPENRLPQKVIEVEAEMKSISDYGALGYLAGEMLGEEIPYFRGLKGGSDELKVLGSALASSGAVSMFHVEGLTPESRRCKVQGLEKIQIDGRELGKVYERLSGGEPEAAFLGCPHFSTRELQAVSRRLEKVRLETFICLARRLPSRELLRKVERKGVKVLHDTCLVVSPLAEEYRCLAVDSAKAASYLRGRAVLRRREEIL